MTYVKDLLEALGFIHSKNIAHLDIKVGGSKSGSN